jgi:hypothetical protein
MGLTMRALQQMLPRSFSCPLLSGLHPALPLNNCVSDEYQIGLILYEKKNWKRQNERFSVMAALFDADREDKQE